MGFFASFSERKVHVYKVQLHSYIDFKLATCKQLLTIQSGLYVCASEPLLSKNSSIYHNNQDTFGGKLKNKSRKSRHKSNVTNSVIHSQLLYLTLTCRIKHVKSA